MLQQTAAPESVYSVETIQPSQVSTISQRTNQPFDKINAIYLDLQRLLLRVSKPWYAVMRRICEGERKQCARRVPA
jgi:hypothetical protein